MTAAAVRFAEFSFDPANRQLRRDGIAVALNARYLDALGLLLREAGTLVTKARFLDEVWRGVPVTDEALTQCIRTLRRELGDDATRPRFIETVPKHGYRFIAAVEPREEGLPRDSRQGDNHGRDHASTGPAQWRSGLELAAAGTGGAVVAGVAGGLIYGAIVSARLSPGSAGAISTVLVVACLTAVIASIGGAGVSAGIGLAAFAADRPGFRFVFGGAAGGFLTGALIRLIQLDAFALLFGEAPRDMTGGSEGALLGAAAGTVLWLNKSDWSVQRTLVVGAVAGACAGGVAALLGGRLLGGSLVLLAERFPASRLDIGGLGLVFGEQSFGMITRLIANAAEGALFVGCAVAAMVWVRHRSTHRREATPPIPPPAP